MVRDNWCIVTHMSPASIITKPISRAFLQELALERFGDMVKVVVDCKRKVIAIGGELHADEEQLLLEDGSKQEDLWGINVFPNRDDQTWIEFDSMINIRPHQNNRTRSVEDPKIQAMIESCIQEFIWP